MIKILLIAILLLVAILMFATLLIARLIKNICECKNVIAKYERMLFQKISIDQL